MSIVAISETAGSLGNEIGRRLAERLRYRFADREIIAYCRGQYCVLAHDAVRLLNRHGFRASRAADGALEWRIAGLLERDGAA